MKDRLPTYPGRVRLVPVSGVANTYTLTRADQPTEEGTALSKANLLTDDVAALFGLTADAVPNDVFRKLGGGGGGGATGHIISGYYVGSGTHGSGGAIHLDFSAKPLFVFILASFNPGYIWSGYCDLTAAQIYMIAERRPYSSEYVQNIFRQNADWSDFTNRLTWHNEQGAESQLNKSGVTYQYIAFFQGGA